ncbi:hypothetical protein ACGFMM_08530 [Streptomyces sp. NPDC048604]|uniref:hypothetical protein n=1 Tax=Streptomyces sp. NPDC048604 TaxID=3365578 RepID=UPI0037180D5C
MAVLVVVDIPGGTKEQYEANNSRITSAPWFPPKGFISHVGAPNNGGWIIVDVWETKEDFRAFAEQARPIFADTGTPPMEAKYYEPANVISP